MAMQIHYIDNDEEITSIVDRLRKSKSVENCFVIPLRSMVFQSLVNLKLINLEAKKNRKKVSLVTQNNLIESLAGKVGIEVYSSMENEKFDFKNKEKEETAVISELSDNQPKLKEKINVSRLLAKEIGNKEKRLANLGTENYFVSQKEQAEKFSSDKITENKVPDRFYKKEKGKKELERPMDFFVGKKGTDKYVSPVSSLSKNAVMSDMLPHKEAEIKKDYSPEETFSEKTINQRTEEQIKSFFSDIKSEENKTHNILSSTEKREPKNISGKFKKIVLAFSAASLLVVLAVIFYIFIPRAEVKIFPKGENREIEFNFNGSTKLSSPDWEAKLFPVRIIEKEKAITESFAATGKSASTGEKAHGKIIIFNNYSSASQPLVATTRFLSQEGKLFRLVKGVVVPGMTQIGSEIKPGVIEAEVIADEGGESFNIPPSKFSIPGFKDSPKYDKFYAQSEKPMSGGRSTNNQLSIISQQDVEKAKQKIESSLKEEIIKMLTKELSEGEIIIPGSEEIVIMESAPVGRIGDFKEVFEYQARAKVKAFVLNEQQLKDFIGQKMEKEYNNSEKLKLKSMELEYRQADANFEEDLITVKTEIKVCYFPVLNLEELKKSFLGKNENQVRNILESKAEIEKTEIYFWPTFISNRIPNFARQVKVEVEE